MRDYKEIENEIEGLIGAGHKIASNPRTSFPKVRAMFIHRLGELCGELAVAIHSRPKNRKDDARYDEWVPADGDYGVLEEMAGDIDKLDDDDHDMVDELFTAGYREGVAKAVDVSGGK